MFKYKIGGVFFIVTKSPVKSEKTDMLFNWTVPELDKGDKTFMEIHNEAGSSISKECQGALARFGKADHTGVKVLQVGEAVITSAGMLPAKNIIHCVVPNYRIKEEKENQANLFLSTVNYALALVNEYSRTHLTMRKIALTPFPTFICGETPDKTIKHFIRSLITNAENYNIKEVKIVCNTEKEYDLYKDLFSSEFISFGDRLYSKLFGA